MALLYLYAGLGGLGCGFCILHYPLTRQGFKSLEAQPVSVFHRKNLVMMVY